MKCTSMRKVIVLLVVLSLCLSGITEAVVKDPTLLDDHFDNEDFATAPGGVNGGFLAEGFSRGGSNTPPDPGPREEGTLGIVDASNSSNNYAWAHMVSLSSFDGAGLTEGLTATFIVDNWKGTVRENWTTLLALRPNNDYLGNSSKPYDAESIAGLVFSIGGDMRDDEIPVGLFAAAEDGLEVATGRDKLYEDTTVIPDDLVDGFIVVVTATPAGWSLDIEGVPSMDDASGSWGTFGYNDIFNDTTYVKVRVNDHSSKDTWVSLDRITVEAISPVITNPSPADEALGVPIDTAELTWDDPDDPDAATFTYDVYFGTDPNYPDLPLVASGDINSYTLPSELDWSTDYFWRVDTLDPNNGNPYVATSKLLSFQSAIPVPDITMQPEDYIAAEGNAAVFTIAATAPVIAGGPNYQWYKVGTPDVELTGETGETLTFDPVAFADAGDYYCNVSNDLGDSVNSDIVSLSVFAKETIAHYTFEGNANDVTGNGYDGDPCMVAYTTGDGGVGPTGEALDLDGSGSVLVDNIAAALNDNPELSISVWVKSINTGTNNEYIKLTDSPGDNGIMRYDSDGDNGEDNVQVVSIPTDTGLEELQSSEEKQVIYWQHNVMTWKAGVGLKLYINGNLDTPTAATGTSGATTSAMTKLLIGNGWEGLIDEVMVFNHALTQAEVDDIISGVGEPICLGQVGPADTNFDCVVDMLDFEELVNSWLMDNFQD